MNYPDAMATLDRLALTEQCRILGIPLDTTTFTAKKPIQSPERMVLESFKAQGWLGVYAEWRFILTVLKLLCERHRHDHRLYSYDIFWLTPAAYYCPENFMHHGERMRAALIVFENSTKYDMLNRFFWAVKPDQFGRVPYRHAQKWLPSMLLEFYDALGKDTLRKILHLIVEDGERRRFGWPDLTLVRDGRVMFVEVKCAGEQLSTRQIEIIRDVMLPCGLDARVIEIQPDKG